MKYGILGDIHGNLEALETVLVRTFEAEVALGGPPPSKAEKKLRKNMARMSIKED